MFVEIKYYCTGNSISADDLKYLEFSRLISISSIIAITPCKEFRLPMSDRYIKDYAVIETEKRIYYTTPEIAGNVVKSLTVVKS